MAVVHSAGHYQSGDAMMEEVIVVTAAVSTDQIRFKVKGIGCCCKTVDGLGRGIYPVSQTKGFRLEINRGTCKERDFLTDFLDFIELTLGAFIIEAADFAGYDTGFRNDVGGRSTLYGADIHSRIADPATGDRIDGMSGGFDGVDSIFGRKGSMGSPSVENGFKRKNRGCLIGSVTNRACQIKDIGFL